VFNTWWGADPRILLNLYLVKSLIRLRIEYGIFFFHHLSKSSSLKLQRLQYKAIKLALGLRNSTPINVVLAEAKEPSIKLRGKYICRNFLSRVFALDNHQLIRICENIIDLEDNPTIINRYINVPVMDSFRFVQKHSHIAFKHNIPLGYTIHYDSLLYIPKINLKAGMNLENPPSTNISFLDIFNKELKNTHCLFTDGSKTPESSFIGFAFTNIDNTISKLFRSPRFLSIYSVEALAILEALNYISHNEIKQISIFSDSKSVLESLLKPNIMGKSSILKIKIKDTIRQLEAQGYNINIIWIPAHKGIAGNELADGKAKEAIRSGRDSQIYRFSDKIIISQTLKTLQTCFPNNFTLI